MPLKKLMKLIPGRTVSYSRNAFGRIVKDQTPSQKKRAARQKAFEKKMRGGFRP